MAIAIFLLSTVVASLAAVLVGLSGGSLLAMAGWAIATVWVSVTALSLLAMLRAKRGPVDMRSTPSMHRALHQPS